MSILKQCKEFIAENITLARNRIWIFLHSSNIKDNLQHSCSYFELLTNAENLKKIYLNT